jgi:hypothetical protein
MYAGHFAAALAMKAKEPRTPTWALLLSTGFIDVLFGAFVLLGIERATVTPGQSPGFRLDFIDWSHSLAMAAVWSIAYGACFFRRGRAVATWCGFAVFSHALCDLPMHPGDMALWPKSEAHLGLGLWVRWPHGWWFFELAMIALAATYYLVRARRLHTFGGRGALVVLVVVLLHVFNSPWLAPTR